MLHNTRANCRKALDWLYASATENPLIWLLVLLALQTLPYLWTRELWYSDEIRYANVFEHVYHKGKWLVLYLNGQYYPDKPPVYFWLLALIRLFIGTERPPLFFFGAAVSGGLYLWATWALSRATLGKQLKQNALHVAAGFVLLSTFYFVGLCHYSRMDLLFGALIIASEVCLFRAWLKKNNVIRWCVSGFGLAALATLTKGPLGLAFPLLSSLVFLAWRGRLKRFWSKDVLYGLLVCVGILLLWLAAVLLIEDPSYLWNILHDQIYKRATNTWHHEQPFYHYLLTFPAAFVPWTLLLVVFPWKQMRTKAWWRNIAARRTLAPAGETYLWICFLSGFVLLSAVSIKIVVYLLPLFAPLAVLTGLGLLRLKPEQSDRLFLWTGRFWLLLGVVLVVASLVLWGKVSALGLSGCGWLAGLLGWLFLRWIDRRRVRQGLALAVAGVTIWLIPAGFWLAPSLDATLSPQAQAGVLRAYIQKGYAPVVYKVYSGTYSYYAGQNLPETDDPQKVLRVLEDNPKAILAIRDKHWKQWQDKPQGLQTVNSQRIADKTYLLLVKGGVLDSADIAQAEAAVESAAADKGAPPAVE